MAVAETQSAQVDDQKVREIIADLLRRVGDLEKQNGATEKRQAASETKHAASEKRHADDAKDVAAVKAQIPFLATKEQLADFRTEALTEIANLDKKLEVGFANTMTVIAKMETQNEKNSKHNIMWVVGTGIALAAAIFAMFQTMLPATP